MGADLFPSLTTRNDSEDWLTRRLTLALERVRGGNATPSFDREAFERQLAYKDFERPESLDALLEWTIGHLETGGVQMTHPRYFGLFNPSPSYPSECADRIGAALNPQICVLSHAPAAVMIERHLIEQIAIRLGFPQGSGGHFTSGGSEANATSVICALTQASSRFAHEGCRAFSGQPRLYVSRESHLAWLKIAHSTGMGRRAVRMIDTDGNGRMCEHALARQLQADADSGDVPIMIAATAGTTNAGMIDPLGPCAALAQQHGAWFHVDAAWGGALIADTEQTDILAGIERADSVTIDAHKWFATTMGTGMFITPHVPTLEASFHAKASYMPSSDAEVDYYLTSLQWSRRFSGLRLFLSLASGGWEGFAKHIRKGQRLIRRLNSSLCASGWMVKNDSEMALSCLLPPSSSTRNVEEIVALVIGNGNVWVSVALLEETPIIRVCVTNGNTSEKDIDHLVKELNRAATD